MAAKRERILVVEDNSLNRQILTEILSPYYETASADNGKTALELLNREAGGISAILLDLVMPVMDGYRFLQEMKGKTYSGVPVIVLTGESDTEAEERALEAGACDFVTKPYQTAILLSRLRNAIARSQVRYLNQLRHAAEHDPLTDLYNQTYFFKSVQEMFRENPGRNFVLCCIDIDRFQILRSMWGEAAANRFLIYTADLLRDIMGRISLCRICRVEMATFCICAEYDSKGIENNIPFLLRRLAAFDTNCLIEPSIGVYRIEDVKIPVESMYLAASIAMHQCSGKYMDYVRLYQSGMSEELIREQTILDSMETALEQRQFVVYLQPKYNLQTNTPYGAEALVRWNHPAKGMIPPGMFISIFEKNGFIGKLDNYIWESVCQILRRWLDSGLAPAPISVNMSRADLYNPNLIDAICGLIRKYRLKPELLNLELTESTYMDNPELMFNKVQKLRELGFVVMLDDFGSAYSSLNMLKDIQVDFLKIDMKFLQSRGDDTRSERLIAAIVRMAGWLELPVIVEGVETQEQYDFLQSIGCGYIQGYYFEKPMPVGDYENLVSGMAATPFVPRTDIKSETVRAIWNSDPGLNYLLNMLLNMLPQPVAIYEFEKSGFNLLRTNLAFSRTFGYGRVAEGNLFCKESILPSSYQEVLSAFWEAVNTQEAVQCDYTCRNSAGEFKTFRLFLKYLGKMEVAYVLIATFLEKEAKGTISSENALPITIAAEKVLPDKAVFDVASLRSGMSMMARICDTVRVIDPLDCAIITFNEDGTINKEKRSCFLAWGKNARCENCISRCAIDMGKRQIKYEVFGNQPFVVISVPIVLSVGEQNYLVAVEFINATENEDGYKGNKQIFLTTGMNSLIYKDELTKAYNRRYLNRLTTLEFGASLNPSRLAILMVDVRRFKSINDTYGHLTGDLVLEKTAGVLLTNVRGADKVIRLGGDEFLILLMECDEKAALAKARELKQAVSAICYSIQDRKYVEINIGCSAVENFDQKADTVNRMIDEADMRMYREKKDGEED